MTNPTPHILTEEELDNKERAFLSDTFTGNGSPLLPIVRPIIASHRALQARVTELELNASCDVCMGTGTPMSGNPCICKGTGLAYVAMSSMREILYETETRLAKLEEQN